MVCEHVYMNISPPPIIELATALGKKQRRRKTIIGGLIFIYSNDINAEHEG